MARETLPVALRLMFGHEGGYVNRKTDSGGPTKYGITAKTLGAHRKLGRAATAAEVKALTIAEAEKIYRTSYWVQSGGDLLPVGLDYAAFDFGVNSGPGTAVRKLQKVVGVAQDGIVGAQTIAAVEAYPGGVQAVIRAYCDERMRYLRGIGGKTGWPSNGRGWTIRVTGKDPNGEWKDQPGVIGNALRLAAGAQAVENPPVAGGKANPANTSIVETLKKPEAWGPIGGLLSSLGAIAAGSGPIQWALAVCLVAAVGYGIYRLVKRDRAEG